MVPHDATYAHGTTTELVAEVVENRSRYSAHLGNRLRERMHEQLSQQADITDLTDEISLLRVMVGNHIERYESATNELDQMKAEYQLVQMVQQVADTAAKIAKISTSRAGVVNNAMLTAILANVSSNVNDALSEHRQVFTQVGIDPDLMSKAIVQTISENVYGQGALDSGPRGISTKPAAVSSDDLIKRMLETVPIAPLTEQRVG